MNSMTITLEGVQVNVLDREKIQAIKKILMGVFEVETPRTVLDTVVKTKRKYNRVKPYAAHRSGSWKPWNKEDDETVASLKKQGVSDKEIGKVVGRTWVAVSQRVTHLRKVGVLPFKTSGAGANRSIPMKEKLEGDFAQNTQEDLRTETNFLKPVRNW